MKLKTKRNRTKKIPLVGVGCWTLGVGFIPAVAGGCVNEAWMKGGREEKREIPMMLSLVTLTTTWSN